MMAAYYWDSISKTLKKHVVLTFLMVVLIFISSLILGLTVDLQQSTEETAVEYEETYGEKNFYSAKEALSDLDYYQYIDESNDSDFEKLLNFKNALLNSKDFTYIAIPEQFLELSFEVPEICLYNYEEGYSDSSVQEYDGKLIYQTKAIEVSDAFFEEFPIELSQGEPFSQEDYVYQEGKPIPVLLGSAYQDEFQIGDSFEGNYLFEEITFIVTGFLESESFFYSSNRGNFVSCERYMVLPALSFHEASYFSKIALLQQMCGVISSHYSREKTAELYQNYLEEAGLGTWDLLVVNPESASSVLETYSAMTSEVAKQFQLLVVIMLVFSCIAMTTVILGMLKENHETFGIFLLCGASFRMIATEAVGLVGSILLFGDFLAAAALLFLGVATIAILTVQIVIAAIALVSCSTCVFYLRRMNISDIIGGKE